jgi:hypothetical protein
VGDLCPNYPLNGLVGLESRNYKVHTLSRSASVSFIAKHAQNNKPLGNMKKTSLSSFRFGQDNLSSLPMKFTFYYHSPRPAQPLVDCLLTGTGYRYGRRDGAGLQLFSCIYISGWDVDSHNQDTKSLLGQQMNWRRQVDNVFARIYVQFHPTKHCAVSQDALDRNGLLFLSHANPLLIYTKP